MDGNLEELHHKLCRYGIKDHSAHHLLHRHEADYIEGKIDVLEFVLSETPGKISSPGGYLFQSIECDYLPPENYKPPDQRAEEQKRKDAIIARRNKELQLELAEETTRQLKKSQQKLENATAAQLALHMDPNTEERLRQFINDQRDPFLRPCDDYDLRASTIESKSRDYAAGTFFNILRIQFFKQICPNAFE